MSKWGRSDEERALEIAYAIGNGIDPIEHLQHLTRARGWTDGENDE